MVTFPLDLNLLDYDKTMEHRTTLQKKNGIEVLKMAILKILVGSSQYIQSIETI